jgi:hypothetical protein
MFMFTRHRFTEHASKLMNTILPTVCVLASVRERQTEGNPSKNFWKELHTLLLYKGPIEME